MSTSQLAQERIAALQERVNQLKPRLDTIRAELDKVVVGQRYMIEKHISDSELSPQPTSWFVVLFHVHSVSMKSPGAIAIGSNERKGWCSNS